ncbi:O-acyltransferase [Bacteroidota bacterium]|nr:O-acyltransferase [Bacteroidota bacterium]
MMLTSVIDWWCGMRVEQDGSLGWKKFWLWFSIGSNLTMLFMFKYLDFALGDSAMVRWMSDYNATAWIVELGKYTIPAGISFYTFQSISYVVDVYRGQEKAEHNLPKFMLYVSFFPQLVAGPIERFGKLHAQLFAEYSPRWEDIRNGMRLVIYGLFLKVAVADNLASVVDAFYSDHNAYTQADAWLATFYFTFQVYTDFFGYSLLAQGSALLFGIHLMDNFNKPFISKSIPEFWQRWHISLSTWFRDYLFIPVGGNKRGPWVLAMAAMLVFFTSGLWHGANGTMIAFGVAQGLLYLFDRFIFKKLDFVGGHFNNHQGKLPLRRRLWDGFRTVKTGFFFMMTLVWFRSATMDQASEVFGMLWIPGYIGCRLDGLEGIAAPTLAHGLQIPLFLCVFLLLDLWVMKDRADVWLGKFSMPIRWIMYVAMALSIWVWGGAINHPFVYFQF